MGATFDLQHINFISYISSEIRRPAPRCERSVLRDFLYSISYEIEDNIISTDEGRREGLRQTATALLKQVDEKNAAVVTQAEVAEVLAPLRDFFTGYHLYVLLIPTKNDERLMRDTYDTFVFRSQVDVLVLMPKNTGTFVNIVDPFPALQALADAPIVPPAAVFWSKSGAAVALSMSEASWFFRENFAFDSKYAPKNPDHDYVDSVISYKARDRKPKTILHISDLHFGDSVANKRRSYIKQHLGGVVARTDRIVISGDLFDQPRAEMRQVFEEFRSDLTAWTKKDPIIIPGNHDVRESGNRIRGIGANSEVFVDSGFVPIVIDDDLEVVFFCFNSCEEGNFARGFVSEQQRTSRGTAFEKLIRERPETKQYLRVAVVHHHPYTYDSKPTVFYEKALNFFSKKEDRFIAFKNADEFLAWCGARDVSLILHGHKHVPHVVMASITVRQKPREIMIVGCGSTTGVEKKPMCYDIISVDPRTKRWNVTFYSDPTGDGSGFDLQNVTLDFRTELPRPA